MTDKKATAPKADKKSSPAPVAAPVAAKAPEAPKQPRNLTRERIASQHGEGVAKAMVK